MKKGRKVENTLIIYDSIVDKYGKLKLSNLTKLFQDLTNIDDLKYRENFDDKNNTWVLLYYEIDISEYPRRFEKITVSTYPSSFNSIYGDRVFEVKDSEGQVIIKALSKWLYVDKDTFKIQRLTEDMAKSYDLDNIDKGTGISMNSSKDRDFDVFNEYSLHIRNEDIDINGHVNNTVYFSYIYDYLENEVLENKEIKWISVTYKNSLFYKDNTYIDVKKEDDNNVIMRIKAEDKKTTYIKIELKDKK